MVYYEGVYAEYLRLSCSIGTTKRNTKFKLFNLTASINFNLTFNGKNRIATFCQAAISVEMKDGEHLCRENCERRSILFHALCSFISLKMRISELILSF